MLVQPISQYDIVVDTLENAIIEANKLKQNGYDLFRGQSGLWSVVSSLSRLSNEQREEIVKKAFLIKQYLMEKFNIINQDEIISVMQHYGIPTHFVDFSTDPKVAAFFSSQINGNEPDEYGCIICINSSEIQAILEIYGKHNDRYINNGEIINYITNNLLRQQAQKGKFLFLPFIGFERHLPYERIVFKNSIENKSKFNELDFFPLKKTEFELFIELVIKSLNIFQII